MPIRLKCSCGRSLQVKDEFAGRKVRCPSCASVLKIPLPDESEDAEDEAFNQLNAASDEDEKRPARKRSEPPDEEPEQEPEPRRRPRPVEKPVARKLDVRKKTSRGRRSSGPRVSFEEGWFGSINAGVAGGVLMMIIAAVWFFVGLAADRIFFYPPVLFVIGIGAIFKGLTGGD